MRKKLTSTALLPFVISALAALLLLSLLYYFGMQQHRKLIAEQTQETIELRGFHTQLVAAKINELSRSASQSSQALSQHISLQYTRVANTQDFDHLFQRWNDGSLRSNGDLNYDLRAGLFLPKDHTLEPAQKQQIMQIQSIVESYANGAREQAFVNSWFMTTQGGILIYWPDNPDFVFHAKPDFSYVGTPWLHTFPELTSTLDLPRTYWTQLERDPVPNVWMLSAVTPVYINNQWIGNVGHDIPLDNLMQDVALLSEFAQSQFVLINNEGLILASDHFKQPLLANDGKLNVSELTDRNWEKVYQSFQAKGPSTGTDNNAFIQNQRVYNVADISEHNWYLISSVPLQPITTQINDSFDSMKNLTLLSTGSVIFLLFFILSFFRYKTVQYVESLKSINNQLSFEKERYQQLSENSDDIVYLCLNDAHWTMLYLNGAVEKFTGFQAEQFIHNKDLTWNSFICEQDRDAVRQTVNDAINQQDTFEMVFRVQHKNGNELWALERGKLLKTEDGVEYLQGVITDITELKHSQQSLELLNSQLDEKIKQRTLALEQSMAELTAMQQQLVETEKMTAMNDLVVGMAHELNTPLGSLNTSETSLVHLLEQLQQKAEDSQLTKSYLNQTLQESQELAQSNLQSLAKLTDLSEKFKMLSCRRSDKQQQVNLSSAIKDTLFVLDSALKEQNVAVHLEVPDELDVICSSDNIFTILSQLISNSLVHGFSRSTSHQISLVATEQAEQIVLQYGDNGQGLMDVDIDKIFLPFRTNARRKGHVGLGLNIVYNLVKNDLNGDIQFLPAEQGVLIEIRCQKA